MTILNTLKGWLGFNRKSANEPLQEILANYDVVDVVTGTPDYPAFMVVTDKGHLSASADGSGITFADPDPINTQHLPVVGGAAAMAFAEKPDFREIGGSSPSPYTATMTSREYNKDLEGRKGLEIYNKMRSDGVVAGTLTLFKTPVYAANWFMQSASEDPYDKYVSEFVWKCLTEYMSISWTQIKLESMLMCDFGYYMFEPVWERRTIEGKRRIVLKKLAPRHPMDASQWEYDDHGGPKAVKIYATRGDSIEEVRIPIEKLLVLTLNREANDVTGRSMMRPMYKHWYYKENLYKIDAIQKERHGIGIPVIKLPPNFSRTDKDLANELGRNLRTNERAHIVLPPGWEVVFAKLEGQPVNVIESIEMHDKAIRESVLASFLSSDSPTKEEDIGLFLKATRFVADSICDAFNIYLIPKIVKYNFGKDTKLPKLKVRRIGEQADWRVMAFAIRSLVGAGIIRPDDELEARMRDEMDLPVADISTLRVVQTPQAGQAAPATIPNATPGNPAPSGKTDGTAGGVGLPRATPTTPPSVGGGNVGNDKGGQS